jgi:hypothetical protein
MADLAAIAPALTAHDPPSAWIADPKSVGCADGQEAWLTNANGDSPELRTRVVCHDAPTLPNPISSESKPVICVGGDGPFGKVARLDLHYTAFRPTP